MPEEPLETVIAAGFARKQVGDRGGHRGVLPELHSLRGGAERVAGGAVHGHSDVVGGLRILEAVGVRVELLNLRRAGAEDLGDVDGGVLELDVRGRDRADVAPGPGPRDPGRRCGRVGRGRRARGGGRLRRVDHRRIGVVARVGRFRRVEDRVGPVGERACRIGRPVGVVRLEAVRDRHPLPVAVEAGQRRQDVIGRMGDQRRMAVREERPVLLEEVEQVRHHLEVGGHVRVVAEEVDVVERENHHVLDAVTELAGRARRAFVLPRGALSRKRGR